MPNVSVIIPNYNHGSYLVQRIESVLNQSYRDFEVIILDDCSTDNSRDIIESYRDHPKIARVVYNDTNSGSPFKQWEKGVELSSGKYIWIAESDDYCETGFLLALTSLVAESSICLAYTQSYDVDGNGRIMESRLNWTREFQVNIWENDFNLESKELMQYLFIKNIIPNASACLISRQFIKDIFIKAPQIKSFKMTGDWYMWTLLFQYTGTRIGFVKEHLNYFRNTTQATRNHNSLKKKQDRLIEETKIVSSLRYAVAPNDVKKRLKDLKKKWFKIHPAIYPVKSFPLSFFDIASYLNTSRMQLLTQFVVYRCLRK
jgi:glycosyltransferase involved in cell wall biosynthesis